MSAVNPYQPPRADVDDIVDASAEFQEPNLFSWRGRIGRLRYLAYVMGAYLLFGVLMAVTGASLFSFRSPTGAGAFSMLLFFAGLIAFFVFSLMAGVQRVHDMDWSGWTMLLLFVPLVGAIMGLIMLFKGGTEGANRFGAPPTPNPLGVKILGLLFPGIVIVGIVAAVVLPMMARR
jgi:uncharacterized membrane protein YhaH (DUF805 family)